MHLVAEALHGHRHADMAEQVLACDALLAPPPAQAAKEGKPRQATHILFKSSPAVLNVPAGLRWEAGKLPQPCQMQCTVLAVSQQTISAPVGQPVGPRRSPSSQGAAFRAAASVVSVPQGVQPTRPIAMHVGLAHA